VFAPRPAVRPGDSARLTVGHTIRLYAVMRSGFQQNFSEDTTTLRSFAFGADYELHSIVFNRTRGKEIETGSGRRKKFLLYPREADLEAHTNPVSRALELLTGYRAHLYIAGRDEYEP